MKDYYPIKLNLETALINHKVELSGQVLQVLNCPIDCPASIRLDETLANEIPIKSGTIIRAPFKRFYVTASATSSGQLSLFVSSDVIIDDIQQTRSSIAEGFITSTDLVGTEGNETLIAELDCENAYELTLLTFTYLCCWYLHVSVYVTFPNPLLGPYVSQAIPIYENMGEVSEVLVSVIPIPAGSKKLRLLWSPQSTTVPPLMLDVYYCMR